MKLTIQGELTDLNTYINAERSNKYAAAEIKKNNTNIVKVEAINQKLYKGLKYAFIDITYYCKDRKKDKDNVAFQKKWIFDGLVAAGVLVNDGWNNLDYEDHFEVDKDNPRIEILTTEVEE